MDSILLQAPEGVTVEHCLELFDKYNCDTVKVLSELWNVQEKDTTTLSQSQKKWKEIRDICNEYDEELNKFMHKKI